MNILIVDDEPVNVLLLESLLVSNNKIKTAENGQIAYEMIEKHQPDLVLLDVLMPVMNGFDTLQKIRSNKQFSKIIVIMVTARVEKDDVKQAMLLGADDYIKKPIDATELYTKIDIHCKLRQTAKKVLRYQKYANIHESMITAQRIQHSLLPDKTYFSRLFPNSFYLYKTRDMVGGDLFFVAENSGKKFISVSDATGHGVPASLISMLTYMGLNFIVNKLGIINPVDVAIDLSREMSISLHSSSDTYVSTHGLDAVFCEIDLEAKILKYVGIRRPLVVIRKNQSSLYVNGKIIKPLASRGDYFLFYIRGNFIVPGENITDSNLSLKEIMIQEGDMFYMFSDGITDQFGGPKEKKFSKKRLLNLLLECQDYSLKLQKLHIYQEVEKWRMDLEQTDDIVLLGIKV